jgi:hypothetical protein
MASGRLAGLPVRSGVISNLHTAGHPADQPHRYLNRPCGASHRSRRSMGARRVSSIPLKKTRATNPRWSPCVRGHGARWAPCYRVAADRCVDAGGDPAGLPSRRRLPAWRSRSQVWEPLPPETASRYCFATHPDAARQPTGRRCHKFGGESPGFSPSVRPCGRPVPGGRSFLRAPAGFTALCSFSRRPLRGAACPALSNRDLIPISRDDAPFLRSFHFGPAEQVPHCRSPIRFASGCRCRLLRNLSSYRIF